MGDLDTNRQPIEVWLVKRNIAVNCRFVFEDETATERPVQSLSMRGAQREITAWLISRGYEPAGRWSTEEPNGLETMRHFRRPLLQRPLAPDLHMTRPLI
jgi:hypothetical protein